MIRQYLTTVCSRCALNRLPNGLALFKNLHSVAHMFTPTGALGHLEILDHHGVGATSPCYFVAPCTGSISLVRFEHDVSM